METIEESVERVIHRLGVKLPTELARIMLLDFYRDRTVELLTHMDEQGVGKIVNFDDVKIGGTKID